jgi:hypothetical protein
VLYGKELQQSIQERCRIQPGMLVKTRPSDHKRDLGEIEVGTLALVTKISSACSFDRDYEGAEEHIFYLCEPFDGTPSFVDYVCNLEQVS